MCSLGSRTVRVWVHLAAAVLPLFMPLRLSSGFKQSSSTRTMPFRACAKPERRKTHSCYCAKSSSWSNDVLITDGYHEGGENNDPNVSPFYFERQSPFPTMPSPLFASLAQSQFELLTNSLVHISAASSVIDDATNDNDVQSGAPKISSMALYLPKENPNTGQLEFVPAVTYPKNPSSERVFIASESSSNKPGGIHRQPSAVSKPGSILGELPGFFKATDLIPTYPFVSSTTASPESEEEEYCYNGAVVGEQEMFTTISQDSPVSVSVVEEIGLPNSPNGPTALSVTLLSGLDTLGVLMIWPSYKGSIGAGEKIGTCNQWKWTSSDKLQITRAAKSLALALSMDNERASSRLANEQFRVAMADGLHQVKSPLQALRTFGKLLQRQLAEENADGRTSASMKRVPMSAAQKQWQALKLADDLVLTGERVIGLIEPMEAIVQEGGGRHMLRGDIKDQPSGEQSSSYAIELNQQQQQQFQLPPSMPILGDFEEKMAFPQDILGSIVYASQAISRERGINFDAVGFERDNLDLPGITVCPKYLKEAVSNLLENAIKYAPLRRKGKLGRPRIPQIKVTLTSNELPLSPGATLYFEDNGPGIPASERDKVFERGYRGEDVRDDPKVSGSGLGLAIARELLSRMGGTISIIEEGPNKLPGTTVRVVLFRDQD